MSNDSVLCGFRLVQCRPAVHRILTGGLYPRGSQASLHFGCTDYTPEPGG